MNQSTRRLAATMMCIAIGLATASCSDDAAKDPEPWASAAALSPSGISYTLDLDEQPLPVDLAGEPGFSGFSLTPVNLSIANLSGDRSSPPLFVETYLFYGCGLLTEDAAASTTGGKPIISKAAWPSGDDRILSPDGFCVQRLTPLTVESGIAAGESIVLEVGLPDVGYVAPADQKGRVITMLGTPTIVQFGIREASGAEAAADGTQFYSPRVSLSDSAASAATTTVGSVDPVVTTDQTSVVNTEAESVFDTIPTETTAVSNGNTAITLPGTLVTPTTVAVLEAGGCPTSQSAALRLRQFDSAPPFCIDVANSYQALVSTSVGDLTIELDPAAAPTAVNSFVYLARYGYFDDTICHRAIRDFVVQCGDPTGTGSGGPGYTFADELPEAGAYQVGTVAMANAGPDTNGSNFFIVTGSKGTQLPPQYTILGHVTAGLDTTVAWMNVLTNEDSVKDGEAPTQELRILQVSITA